MRRFGILLRRDLEELLRGGSFFFLVGALVLCGFAFRISLPASFFESGSLPAVSVAVVNSDDSETGRALFGVVRSLPEIENAYDCDAEEAERLFEAGEVSVILGIPDDLVASLVHNRPAEIRIKAADPLEGAAVFSMASAAADTVNLMQTAVYAYRDIAGALATDKKRFRAAYTDFCSDLIKDAVLYRRFVDTGAGGADPDRIQFLSLLVFLLCAGSALCVSFLAARQISEGRLRRFFCHDLRFVCFFAAKFAACLLLSSALCLLLALLMPHAGFVFVPLRLFVAVLLTTTAVAPLCMSVAFVLPKPQYTALLGLVLLLLLLFGGGGFYPVYRMHAALTAGNPADLCVRLCGWSLGNDVSPEHFALYFAASIPCIIISFFFWNRERGQPWVRPQAFRAPPGEGNEHA